VRFARRLNLDEVEQAIERLERAIKLTNPSILHLYLESGALKQAAHAAGQAKPAIEPLVAAFADPFTDQGDKR
jgi:hypothetical protein